MKNRILIDEKVTKKFLKITCFRRYGRGVSNPVQPKKKPGASIQGKGAVFAPGGIQFETPKKNGVSGCVRPLPKKKGNKSKKYQNIFPQS